MTLLTNGADPRCVDAAGNTPLHYAVLSELPIVAALLRDATAPLDPVNRDGLTPLGMACAAANWNLVRFLLERGAKPECDRAQPALLCAAGISDDDPTGIELLLKRKVAVDSRDALGRTALMVAALQGHAAIAATLLDAGAQVGLADSRGTTALMHREIAPDPVAGAVVVIEAGPPQRNASHGVDLLSAGAGRKGEQRQRDMAFQHTREAVAMFLGRFPNRHRARNVSGAVEILPAGIDEIERAQLKLAVGGGG